MRERRNLVKKISKKISEKISSYRYISTQKHLKKYIVITDAMHKALFFVLLLFLLVPHMTTGVSAQNDYLFADYSTRLLTEEDVKEANLQVLNYAKNEIYAIHGRIFESEELRNYFSTQSWYNDLAK